MAGLVDMEDLLSTISNKEYVGYMREAMSCYSVGAFRGCIVMSYVALFEDIRRKLLELAKVNPNARKISQEIERRAGAQEVFESYMADQLRANGLLEEIKYQRLSLVRDLRNKAAHPSGIVSSAEEARFVYRVVISEFLSEQLLKTTHAVDALLERLQSTNHFPSANINEIVEIVKEDCLEIHDLALPYLIKKLDDGRKSSSSTASQNAERFLIGMARAKNEKYRGILQKTAFSPYCSSSDQASYIGRMVAADGKILVDASETNKARIDKLLADQAKTSTVAITEKLSHPARQIAEMLLEVGEEEVTKKYRKFFDVVAKKYPYKKVFYEGLKDAPNLKAELIAKWKNDARSSSFATSNAFAEALPEIDGAADTILSNADSFALVVATCRGAEFGAWAAEAVRKNKFSDAPLIASAAVKYANGSKKGANRTLSDEGFTESALEFLSKNLNPSAKSN